jgi:hypothetical protein
MAAVGVLHPGSYLWEMDERLIKEGLPIDIIKSVNKINE